MPAPYFDIYRAALDAASQAARSDAVDVVYGTEEGFERLGIPYMAHIRPTEKW